MSEYTYTKETIDATHCEHQYVCFHRLIHLQKEKALVKSEAIQKASRPLEKYNHKTITEFRNAAMGSVARRYRKWKNTFCQ
jgi:7-cyano-7-deazaguanine synthase in queuosine biosynthesis